MLGGLGFIGVYRHARLPADDHELVNGGGALQVDCTKYDLMPAARKESGELAGGGRFSAALQAGEHDDRRAGADGVNLGVNRSEQLDQLVVDDFDDQFRRPDRTDDGLADGLVGDVLRELADDFEIDIGLEQCGAHFAHRFADVLFADFATASEIAQGALKAFGKGFEHGSGTLAGRASVAHYLTIALVPASTVGRRKSKRRAESDKMSAYWGIGVAHSGMDVLHSGMDVAHSGMDVLHSGMDVAHSGMDVAHSGMDVARSGMDVARSGMDVAHSGMDVLHSGMDVARSGIDVARSGMDVTHSGMDVTIWGIGGAYGGDGHRCRRCRAYGADRHRCRREPAGDVQAAKLASKNHPIGGALLDRNDFRMTVNEEYARLAIVPVGVELRLARYFGRTVCRIGQRDGFFESAGDRLPIGVRTARPAVDRSIEAD